MTTLTDIKGIDVQSAEKLAESGASSLEKFLEMCGTKKGRSELADTTGIAATDLLAWTNRADLARVKGISTVYADLLECAGVDTVPELAQRNAENLHAKLEEVNTEKALANKLPPIASVSDWVAQAKELPRAVHY